VNRRRRDLLRGLSLGATAALLSPFVEGMIRDAHGQQEKVRRFVWLGTGNGIVEKLFKPQRFSGPTDWDMPEAFRPLEPFKKDMLLLERFYVPQTPVLHGSGFSAATNTASGGGEEEDATPGGISFDRAMGRALSHSDPVQSLNFAFFHKELYGSNNYSLIYVPHMSADGPGQINPPEWSPRKAFEKYFGALLSGAADPAAAAAAAERRSKLGKSVLDRVVGDIESLQLGLAGTERAKLEQYLESIRTLEKRVTALPGTSATCDNLTAPSMGEGNPVRGVRIDWAHAFVDLIVQAFACGLTHSAALSLMGRAGPDSPFEVTGDDNPHGLAHDGNHARQIIIEQFQASLVARLFEKLGEIPEGSGTAADGTVLLWINACGGNHHGGEKLHPAVIVGSGGGYFKTGRYLAYPEGQQPLARVLISIAQALGTDVTTFGDAEFGSSELPGLTA
jgi:hypothetical protein